jgi:hypothetical protein
MSLLRHSAVLVMLFALTVGASAISEMAAFGAGCWNPPGDAWGASMRYTQEKSDYYLLLDCGLRSMTDADLQGIMRIEAGVPVVRWRDGMIGVGPSASWFWEPKHHAIFDDAVEEAGEYQKGDTLFEPLGRQLGTAILVLAMDAVLSPVTALADNGVRIRPAISLRQRIGEEHFLQISHDFGHGRNDPFNGTTVALTYVKSF